MLISNTKKLLFIFIFMLATNYVFSQNHDTIIDINASYEEARQLAFSGNRAESRDLARQVIEAKPNHYDAYVLIARTYSWDKKYDSAIIIANEVLVKKVGYRDAIDVLIDTYNWEGSADSSLVYCNLGLSYRPNDESFLYKKAALLKKDNNDKLAKYTLIQLLEINPSHEKGNELYSTYKRRIINKVKLTHYFDYFDEPWIRRWHVTSIEVSSKPKIGSFIFRVNMGQLIKDDVNFMDDVRAQFEIDAYPKLGKKNYAYVSYGYAPNGYFPEHRAGLEIYQKLKGSWELSLGLRYLRWSDDLLFYTASVGKYYKNYWFSFRTFITPKNSGVSQSYNLTARRYFATADDYIGLTIGMGASPDDPSNYLIDGNENIQYLNGKKINAVYKERIKKWVIEVGAGFQLDEYEVDKTRNVFAGKLSLTYYLY